MLVANVVFAVAIFVAAATFDIHATFGIRVVAAFLRVTQPTFRRCVFVFV